MWILVYCVNVTKKKIESQHRYGNDTELDLIVKQERWKLIKLAFFFQSDSCCQYLHFLHHIIVLGIATTSPGGAV